ncbi:thioredoxin family protein [Fodinibius salsisoli]|nr:thioredoxin family protein [Fodinibius salsisoli]
MKKQYAAFAFIAMVGVALYGFLPSENTAMDELAIGAQAPMVDHEVEDVSGEMLTLQKVAKENGLLVNFSCNTCPWVSRWEDRYNPIAELAEEHGIGVIALNPNTAIRDDGESLEDMKARAEKSNYQFPYALDEGSKLATAFGATRTPHIYLFNKDMELVYRGAIDDNAASAEGVEQPYLKNAIKALAAGNEINPQSTKSLGCTIKWPE